MERHLLWLAIAIAGCGAPARTTGALTVTTTPAVASPTTQAPTPGHGPAAIPGTAIRFTGGDGSSLERAIVIEGASNEEEGVDSEYWYVAQVLGERGTDWELQSQSLLQAHGHQFDQLSIHKANGAAVDFFFDITGYFGRF
jgi:hypothetical protein